MEGMDPRQRYHHARPLPVPRKTAWTLSLLLHSAALAAALTVAAPIGRHPPRLIGQTSRVELLATISAKELSRPQPAREAAAEPVRIQPRRAEIARRLFEVRGTQVSQPSAAEVSLVEELLDDPLVRETPTERARPAPTTPSHVSIPKRPATPPSAPRPGVEDRPLPELIHNPPPRYPLAAIERAIEGTVLLRLWVSAEGGVDRVEVIAGSGHRVLDAEAVRAVRSWRFVPASYGGEAVAATVRLPVRFDLSKR